MMKKKVYRHHRHPAAGTVQPITHGPVPSKTTLRTRTLKIWIKLQLKKLRRIVKCAKCVEFANKADT